MTQFLILIRGIPGSGKSTYAKSILKLYQDAGKPVCHYEADMYFTDLDGSYLFDPTRLKDAHNWCQTCVEESLKSGYSCIVSNTFIKKWELQPYIDMASSLKVPVTILTMEGKYGNIHGVPDEKIQQMIKNFER